MNFKKLAGTGSKKKRYTAAVIDEKALLASRID